MSFSFLEIEKGTNFTEIKYCLSLELVKEHFITITLPKCMRYEKDMGRYKSVD